jgi:DNA mismatch endonuclease, patch repair protein
MVDVHKSQTRSYNMSRIKGKNTKPEMQVRRFLHARGFRYRLHDKKLPGKPDIVLTKYKTVVLINGCFWHGHINCKYYEVPKTRTDWWLNKINNTIINDQKTTLSLAKNGWKIIVIWECQLKQDKIQKTLKQLLERMNS